MRYLLGWLVIVPLFANGQTIELRPVDIIYGNQIIRSQHQVVVSSKGEVNVIPVEKVAVLTKPNVVISSTGSQLSYLEEGAAAKREQAIYDEVNKRTEEAPFTVLFTGNIPAEIEERRLRLMPEMGIFGNQNQPEAVQQNAENSERASVGDFAPVGNVAAPISNEEPSENAPLSDEERLERLIGG